VISNWHEFALGLCEKGNFPQRYLGDKLKYSWYHGDQAGMWYALLRTHMQVYNPKLEQEKIWCNETTGLAASPRYFGPELNSYMKQTAGYKVGSDGRFLAEVPDDQHILWSTPHKQGGTPFAGLGMQLTYNIQSGDERQHRAFSIHKKSDIPEDAQLEIDICREKLGCYAKYDEKGELTIGCDGVVYEVPKGDWQ
jgi:hypothetical protein